MKRLIISSTLLVFFIFLTFKSNKVGEQIERFVNYLITFRQRRKFQKYVHRPSANPEFENLICACRGDKRQANRLLDYEIRRDQRITVNEAAHRAIERLVRDRS